MVKMINTNINGDFNLILPEHRALRPEWGTEEGWEKARLQSLRKHLTVKDTMFYVGAEEGDMAALCAMWVKDIVLFEPNEKVWPNIKAIWEANKLETPYTFSGFASNETTDSAWNYFRSTFPPSADGEVIGDHGFKELCDPSDIPQIKIDDTLGILKPTAISLDVEGSEWQVLRGAEKTLRELHPKIWLSLHPEFMYRIYEEYSNDLRTWIKALGYKEELLDYQHECHLFYHYE